MNKIYFAITDEDYGGVYISAPNLKSAKSIARGEEIINARLRSFIDLDCHMCKKQTELPTKVLGINEIISEKLHWWFCKNEECEQDEKFEYVEYTKDGSADCYKCPVCGEVFEIPYINR